MVVEKALLALKDLDVSIDDSGDHRHLTFFHGKGVGLSNEQARSTAIA